MMRKAFTLMEVNLAILVMAGGLLSSVVLFSLGYRESARSNEDTASAAYAEEVMGRIALALSDTNVTWQAFNAIDEASPSGCWRGYFSDDEGNVRDGSTQSVAAGVYTRVMSAVAASGVNASMPSPPEFLKGVGLVVTHDRNSPVVKIAFRACVKERQLMTAPLYYTEVIFQGGD